jgi:hypothetical protein
MEYEWDETHPYEHEASGSSRLGPQCLDSSGVGGQTFGGIRNADHSRSHFGNVYNNVYPIHDQPRSDDTKARNLMEALAFNGMNDRLMTIRPACANTCDWFLKTREYSLWRKSARHSTQNTAVWIRGKPGAGKSTLMKYIHDHERQHHRNHLIASFFFNGRSSDPLTKSVEGMYRSLVHQLYAGMPQVAHGTAQKISITRQHKWSIRILENLLREAILGLHQYPKISCYIDALDECAELWEAIYFFEDLSMSVGCAGSFSICLSSRYFPRITMADSLNVSLDASCEHSRDIVIYLSNKFTIETPSRSELQTDIEKRCSGVFLWVVLVVKMLTDLFHKGATRSQLHEALTSMPRGLNWLYESIACPTDPAFDKAMRWMLVTERTLKPEELYFAVRAGCDDLLSAFWDRDEVVTTTIQNYILHVSRGLIEYTEENGERQTQFIHASVRDYLLSQQYDNRQAYDAHCHEMAFKDCQIYLQLCVRGQAAHADMLQRFNEQDKDLPSAEDYPLCDYVWHNILTHLESAYLDQMRRLMDELAKFPIRDYITIGNYLLRCGAGYISPEHSAALLMLLIRNRCYVLANTVLEVEPDFASSFTLTRPDLTTLCGGEWGSPLHEAVACENADFVMLLLKEGAAVDLAGDVMIHGTLQRYGSPLSLAAKLKSTAMVKLLIDHGAHSDSFMLQDEADSDPPPAGPGVHVDPLRTDRGINALHTACMGLDLETVTLLLDRGADVNLPSRGGRGTSIHSKNSTPLHIVTEQGASRDRTAVLTALLNAGANVNATDKDGNTALILACIAGDFEAVVILLDRGADTAHRSQYGTALDSSQLWPRGDYGLAVVSWSGRTKSRKAPEQISFHVIYTLLIAFKTFEYGFGLLSS